MVRGGGDGLPGKKTLTKKGVYYYFESIAKLNTDYPSRKEEIRMGRKIGGSLKQKGKKKSGLLGGGKTERGPRHFTEKGKPFP